MKFIIQIKDSATILQVAELYNMIERIEQVSPIVESVNADCRLP